MSFRKNTHKTFGVGGELIGIIWMRGITSCVQEHTVGQLGGSRVGRNKERERSLHLLSVVKGDWPHLEIRKVGVATTVKKLVVALGTASYDSNKLPNVLWL